MRSLLIFITAVIASAALAQNPSPLERGILSDINQLRANPSAYAGLIRKWRVPDETSFSPEYAVHVLDETVSELQSIHTDPGELILSAGLSRAAADHVRDTGSHGMTGHIGSDGSTFRTRIERYGVWSGSSGENIAYGLDDPRENVIVQLLDFGVEDRGHRHNLLNPAWRYVGIACGPHALYGTMCVMDFAASYRNFIASN